MSTDPELEELNRQVEETRAVQRLLPSAWSAFFARFGRLRPVQTAAIPPLLAGEDVLITAPTAGGKTEAALAPLCERIVRDRWADLSVLLVSPTRALVNDLYARLLVPCEQMRLRLGRKTADHPSPDNFRENILITTPESLESLLTFRRRSLDSLRAVVLDELHLLDGTARGDQLRMLLGRLRAYLKHQRESETPGLQGVALSATVPDAERTAVAYLGSRARVIRVPGRREIEASLVVATGDDQNRARQAMEAAVGFADVRKLLVFVNSRAQVDRGTELYHHALFPNVPVFGHHGSLSKDEREATEERFRQAERAICVATMTLEVGIDIGDIDLIVCVDPPSSLSSFLQRIGRGCRRLQGKTRALCVARDRAGELLFEGLLRQAEEGIPPAPMFPPMRRSVLLQQALAYLQQVEKRRRTLDQFVNALATPAAPIVDRALIEAVLNDMVRGGLLVCRNGVYEPASAGADFIESIAIYSNIATAVGVTLVDADTGRTVATVADIPLGVRGVRVAGRSFDLLPGEDGPVRKVRVGGGHSTSARYYGRGLGLTYAADVGLAVRNRLGLPSDRLAVIESEGKLVVFTWIGQLGNICLAEGIAACSGQAEAKSFALVLSGVRLDRIVEVLRSAVTSLTRTTLSTCPLEQVTDLGAHFRKLTPDGQRQAREDWLDLLSLKAWLDGVIGVEAITASMPVGIDLLTLLDI